MADLRVDLKNLMESHGFFLHRQNKHAIWRRGPGEQVVTSVSPSDWRVIRKIEAQLNRLNKAQLGQLETEMEVRDPRRTVVNPSGQRLTAKLGELVTPQQQPLPAPVKSKYPDSATMRRRMLGYPKEQKEAISLRILELHEQGVSYPEMARVMTLEGFKNMEGQPHTVASITQWGIKQLGLKKRKPKAEPVQTDPVAERLEQTDNKPDLAPRAQALKQLEEIKPAPVAAPLPVTALSPALLALVKDPSISEAKRLRMLLAFVED